MLKFKFIIQTQDCFEVLSIGFIRSYATMESFCVHYHSLPIRKYPITWCPKYFFYMTIILRKISNLKWNDVMCNWTNEKRFLFQKQKKIFMIIYFLNWHKTHQSAIFIFCLVIFYFLFFNAPILSYVILILFSYWDNHLKSELSIK